MTHALAASVLRRIRPRPRTAALGVAGLLMACVVPAFALSFQADGRFLYEDREWDLGGYTGAVQELPIRHADVEVVNAADGSVFASGSTDADGRYAVIVTGVAGTLDLYVRCLSSTDNDPDYPIRVVDAFQRAGGTVDLTGSAYHAVVTDTVSHNAADQILHLGDYVIRDATGTGTAQAFNILDCAVDACDYLAQPFALGRYPWASEFVVYAWNGTQGPAGSDYLWHGIEITSDGSDTDGWADAVILHETGHWVSDMFGGDTNPGGAHYIGDIAQDPRLSYGEGYPTFFAGEVREFRAARLNGGGGPVDDHVSIYADLSFPPPVGTAGGLGFAYDYETGLYDDGTPIGQIGSACETSVTSALWDLVDGPGTPDESPGSDDDPADGTGGDTWAVFSQYVRTLSPPEHWITVEDFYRGWFAVHGAWFGEAGIDSVFAGLQHMPFRADGHEPDDAASSAPAAVPESYAVRSGGGVVVNECDLGASDAVELANTGTAPVNLAGWKIHAYRNGYADDGTRIYTFAAFTLYPGAFVVVHEGGSPADNGPVHLYGGGFSIPWFNTDDGACSLLDGTGAAVDFVRWDNVNGTDPSLAPVPPGTAWSGTVASPPEGMDLGRDGDGDDAGLASDFGAVARSLGAPDLPGTAFHTIFPGGDRDHLRLTLSAGALAVVRAESPHSAGEPRIEILDGAGEVVGAVDRSWGLDGLAELQTYVQSDTAFTVRITHTGPYTDYAPVSVSVYLRPVAAVLSPPAGVSAAPAGESDTADPVTVSWFNGGAYDQVKVQRDGGSPVTLAGNAVSYVDAAPAGLHTYAVWGVIGGAPSPPSSTRTYAGTVGCHAEDGLESGASGFRLDAPWGRTGARAAAGSWSLTDSPSGSYANNADVSAEVVAPVVLTAYPYLDFDHICVTEAGYDFGYVDVSTDYGNQWTNLARYDMSSYPEWSDGAADPGDWKHEHLDLNPYVGKTVRVRFRLASDAYVTADGWYLDDVVLSDPACTSATGLSEAGPAGTLPALRALANPFRGALPLAVRAAPGAPVRVEVFDVAGRLVRRLFDGPAPAGELVLSWDGRDGGERGVAAGLYLVRAGTSAGAAVARVVRLR